MENAAGEALAIVAAAAAVVVIVVDAVDHGPDSQASRAALLISAPLRELRAGRRILGDGRTDDGIYYGLHVFQRYLPVASLSRFVPLQGLSTHGAHPSRNPPMLAAQVHVYVCALFGQIDKVRRSGDKWR